MGSWLCVLLADECFDSSHGAAHSCLLYFSFFLSMGVLYHLVSLVQQLMVTLSFKEFEAAPKRMDRALDEYGRHITDLAGTCQTVRLNKLTGRVRILGVYTGADVGFGMFETSGTGAALVMRKKNYELRR